MLLLTNNKENSIIFRQTTFYLETRGENRLSANCQEHFIWKFQIETLKKKIWARDASTNNLTNDQKQMTFPIFQWIYQWIYQLKIVYSPIYFLLPIETCSKRALNEVPSNGISSELCWIGQINRFCWMIYLVVFRMINHQNVKKWSGFMKKKMWKHLPWWSHNQMMWKKTASNKLNGEILTKTFCSILVPRTAGMRSMNDWTGYAIKNFNFLKGVSSVWIKNVDTHQTFVIFMIVIH